MRSHHTSWTHRTSWKGVVPTPGLERVRQVQQHRASSAALTRWLRDEVGERFRDLDAGPVASSGVVARTALMKRSELGYKSRRRVFLGSGMQLMLHLLRAAEGAGLRLGESDAAFELGCGGARLIRHLRNVSGLRLVGSDVIEENVQWCRSHVPGVEFHQNQLEPPLGFAPDSCFDFVFAYSVFTHIPMQFQLPWIHELGRVLKPGGIAAVTVLGPEMARIMLDADDLADFESNGEFTLDATHPSVSASSALIGSWDVFMTPDRVRELYGQALEVVGQQAGGQSIVTLRKPLD